MPVWIESENSMGQMRLEILLWVMMVYWRFRVGYAYLMMSRWRS